MAKAGYGKRHVPDEAPRGADDFGHLDAREAALAAYIDRLPEGAAIGYKVLAEELPQYGQQACRSALDRLTRAGHLRRIKVHVTVADGGKRWVTRTHFSRTARDAAWWARYVRFVRGIDAPGQPPAPDAVEGERPRAQQPQPQQPRPSQQPQRQPESAPEPEPGVPAPRSEAYDVLAALGGQEPRLQLSDGECVALEHLVDEWFVRGLGREQITRALVAGLPASVHSAGAFLRTRLENKMPPVPQPARTENGHREEILGALMMCAFCDEDETTTTLVDGVCGDCRADIDRDEASGATGDVPDTFLARPCQPLDVAARVAELRSAAGRGTVTVPRPRR
ncbi:hypothetical protein OHA98_02580 [Streptomyces sp. NBC_00654]|uniref:hypothetical protein n=1 Tax=Streptomyces sp. NBC_00654 TaxID=2975799 RepID=UPI0022586BFC|nr:hypothetical protein [Streptomyces sp. NBC_00654]MCX4963721.1 hypothetical protein [Streptomyces sp. NBC_00654]